MTLGEKIRCARKCIGISQGQLAKKMCVSRSAVAKWETDKGLPDVENLKLLSRLLCVSVDSLLDDGKDPLLIREDYCLEDLGSGCTKVKKDRLMRKKFPESGIHVLMGRPRVTEHPPAVDRIRGFLSEDPLGNPEYRKSARNPDRAFYLVDREEDQLFVTVTDAHLEIVPLGQKQTGKTFCLGSWSFFRLEEL